MSLLGRFSCASAGEGAGTWDTKMCSGYLAGKTYCWVFSCAISPLSVSSCDARDADCTFMHVGHICRELHFQLHCRTSQAPGGVWFLPTSHHGQMWVCISRAISLPRSGLPAGRTSIGFNYLPAEPQTPRSPHPPDNFCQILLARQEALDGEGQWSRGREWAEKKQKFRHYIWRCSQQDCPCSKNYISVLDFNSVLYLLLVVFF